MGAVGARGPARGGRARRRRGGGGRSGLLWVRVVTLAGPAAAARGKPAGSGPVPVGARGALRLGPAGFVRFCPGLKRTGAAIPARAGAAGTGVGNEWGRGGAAPQGPVPGRAAPSVRRVPGTPGTGLLSVGAWFERRWCPPNGSG